jgi:HAD superfamily hydrolase (TIGR01509 family)
MIQAMIFDMDGLMIDTEPLYWEVARQLARQYGKSVTDPTLRRMMGRSRIDSMCIFAQDCGITSRTPEQLLIDRENLMLQRYAAGVEPMPGLREILARFHGRLRYAIATSSPKKFTDVLLPAMGIASEFEVIQTGDDIARGKPEPEIYLKCIERMKLSPGECVVLEDSLAGATSAHRAGAIVIAVPSYLTASDDFSGVATDRVENLQKAAERIDNLLHGD